MEKEEKELRIKLIKLGTKRERLLLRIDGLRLSKLNEILKADDEYTLLIEEEAILKLDLPEENYGKDPFDGEVE